MNELEILLSHSDTELIFYLQNKLNDSPLDSLIQTLCESVDYSIKPTLAIFKIYEKTSSYLTPPQGIQKVVKYILEKKGAAFFNLLLCEPKFNKTLLINAVSSLNNATALTYLLEHTTILTSLEEKLLFFKRFIMTKNESVLEVLETSILKDPQFNGFRVEDCLDLITHACDIEGFKNLERIKKHFTKEIIKKINFFEEYKKVINNVSTMPEFFDYIFNCVKFFLDVSITPNKNKIKTHFFSNLDINPCDKAQLEKSVLLIEKDLSLNFLAKIEEKISCPITKSVIVALHSKKEKEKLNKLKKPIKTTKILIKL